MTHTQRKNKQAKKAEVLSIKSQANYQPLLHVTVVVPVSLCSVGFVFASCNHDRVW